MPPPDQSNLDTAQRMSAEQFGRQSDRYGRSHILADTRDVEESLVGISSAGKRALDVATGGGHTALRLARMGWTVVAGDISERMIENARALIEAEGFSVETRLFPAEAIPFSAGEFDLVTVRVAPHHFSSPGKFVAESSRVLAPGGRLLVIDGTVPDDDGETEEWLHKVEKWRDPSHGRLLSRRTWESLAAQNGLQIASSKIYSKKQPDLDWYFETAATTPENRIRVLEAVQDAPPGVRRALRLGDEGGKIVWWWPMIRMLARKP